MDEWHHRACSELLDMRVKFVVVIIEGVLVGAQRPRVPQHHANVGPVIQVAHVGQRRALRRSSIHVDISTVQVVVVEGVVLPSDGGLERYGFDVGARFGSICWLAAVAHGRVFTFALTFRPPGFVLFRVLPQSGL